MDAAVCFSGGKDSALAALLLEPFYDVTLVTGTFGVTDDHEHARAAAAALGFPFETVALDRDVAEATVDRMVADGYPRSGIQEVHEHCLEVLAGGASGGADASDGSDARSVDGDAGPGNWDTVADGTRRDDRVPRLDRSAARSLEDRHGVDYLAPLAGIGRGSIDAMAARRLRIETGPSETVALADYEVELRALLADRHGDGAVESVFPEHTQSVVRDRARVGGEDHRDTTD